MASSIEGVEAATSTTAAETRGAPSGTSATESRRDGARSEDRTERLRATAPDDSSAEGQQISHFDAFRVKCLASARYHEDRERFFAWVHKSAMFLVVAFGTASLATIRNASPVLPILITLAGTIDLVFDVSGKARLHSTLRKQIYSILADAELPADDLASLERRLTLVYADEPAAMHAVNAVAYNGAMASLGRPEKYFLKVDWWPRFIRHLWPYAANSFKTYEELGLSP